LPEPGQKRDPWPRKRRNLANVGSIAQTLVQVLKQCDGTLTRENLMKQAANLEDLELPMLLPGSGSTRARPIST